MPLGFDYDPLLAMLIDDEGGDGVSGMAPAASAVSAAPAVPASGPANEPDSAAARRIDEYTAVHCDATSAEHAELWDFCKEKFECSVCVDAKAGDRLYRCPNEHVICATCLGQLVVRTCPTCHAPNLAMRARLAEQLRAFVTRVRQGVRNTLIVVVIIHPSIHPSIHLQPCRGFGAMPQVKCPFNKYGCTADKWLRDIEAHRTRCNFAPVDCVYGNCIFSGPFLPATYTLDGRLLVDAAFRMKDHLVGPTHKLPLMASNCKRLQIECSRATAVSNPDGSLSWYQGILNYMDRFYVPAVTFHHTNADDHHPFWQFDVKLLDEKPKESPASDSAMEYKVEMKVKGVVFFANNGTAI